MNCKNCGAPMVDGAEFCESCGAAAEKAKKPDNKKVIIAVVISTLVIVAICVTLIIIFSNKSANDKSAFGGSKKAAVSETLAKALNESTAAPTEAPTEPPACYSSSLTYKRMPEIHNSERVSGDTVTYVYNFIYNFDMECAAYMNGTGPVPSALAEGTTAYNQQTSYKKNHPGLTQSYDSIVVNEVRRYGNYLYVWVDEVISQSENGVSKTSADHWVYKLSDEAGVLYVSDYTADPAYK